MMRYRPVHAWACIGIAGLCSCGSVYALAHVGAAAPRRTSVHGDNAVVWCGDVRLTGWLGRRLDMMIANHVLKTDARGYASVFLDKSEHGNRWQTEFWGKYMHAAVPFARYAGSDALRTKIAEGVDIVLSAQETDGYIGNYPPALRCGEGWDVWGMKYTMMGLMHYYDGTRLASDAKNGDRALVACKRVCDYLISQIGPDGKKGLRLYQTGNWAGLASSSILEPVVWLYRRTHEKHYLDFAAYIVDGMTEAEDGPRLLDLALKGVSVADRNGYGGVKPNKYGVYATKNSRSKAYEMMSCYQGLLEYYEITGRQELLEAAVATVDQILADEVNVAGGATSSESWFHGARKQHLPYLNQQETCVVTTWMRLLEKMLTITGDSRYADALECTFYNAYLASLNREADEFAAYTPLNGYRSRGHHHCWMHTNCCNANGPRGFLAFLRTLLQAGGNTVYMNFYASGSSRVVLPESMKEVFFDTYTLYPREGFARMVNRTRGSQTFELALRIPSWCDRASVRINGRNADGTIASGGYWRLNRSWETGDVVELELELRAKMHQLDHCVAFTRGPIVLARDVRFCDGMIDEPFKLLGLGGIERFSVPEFVPSRSPSEDFWMVFKASLPINQHHEHPEGNVPPMVTFCDYASAANLWTSENGCRVWILTEYAPWQDRDLRVGKR